LRVTFLKLNCIIDSVHSSTKVTFLVKIIRG
jgi:hypothetical protein